MPDTTTPIKLLSLTICHLKHNTSVMIGHRNCLSYLVQLAVENLNRVDSAGFEPPMKNKASTTLKGKARVSFGHLFLNMQHQLSMVISTDKTDVWAIAYRLDGDSFKWGADFHCPTWWAESHGAEMQIPDSLQLEEALSQLVHNRLHELTRV